MQSTAILVFANSSSEELLHKPVRNGEILFDTLTKNTLKTVQKTELPYFHFTEKEQMGNSFGERFTNALNTVFNKGFDKVIAIGNDSPQLRTSHLKEAVSALRSQKTVVGPSLDGGFYLIGLHKSNFDPVFFQQLPWRRFNLLSSLLRKLTNKNCAVYRLQVLNDLDTVDDIKRLCAFTRSISTSLRKILTSFLFIKKNTDAFFIENFSSVFVLHPYNKGSPFLFHF
ncbi:DUF2064 domain-containing protein [Maribacter sp. MMG018]|uniref:TIGR04282 family arsenosugar biosynthesis glycosyltransferase n=1 Tax=Maribacter sp. MMG018 TaxID=2822688 RepID=UPI001B37DE70|nr:DUF2064 domain-containing protein [Maribacter sp. MMG018]MBQ4913437.1 DUF2064 domain-containing protein [Maribacter sp. MMG018]